MGRVGVIGTFDSKEKELIYLIKELESLDVVTIDVGIYECNYPVDIRMSDYIPENELNKIRNCRDNNLAMTVICNTIEKELKHIVEDESLNGIIGMGGGRGTAIVTCGMRTLPVGFPKICISTIASGNNRPYVGTKDIIMIPSIVDLNGINPVFCEIIAESAAAMKGMVSINATGKAKREKAVFITSYGNVEKCVQYCAELLQNAGKKVMIFHATGTGGRAMEELVREGYAEAVLDITTTEWADELCGGILNAGKDRLDAAGACGIPQVIVPGCIDMVNFAGMDTVPKGYRGRKLYSWNPEVTLMRTTVEENRELGKIFAKKANHSKGKTVFLIPEKGFSMLGADGKLFEDRTADKAFEKALKSQLNENIPVYRVPCNINDLTFAKVAVKYILELLEGKEQ